MNGQPKNGHITAEELALYYGGDLSDEAAAPIEEHLAECHECIVAARRLYSFSILCERWLDGRRLGHSSGNIVARAVDVAQMEVADPSRRERLKNWAERWSGRAEGVVRIVLGAGADTPVILTGGLEALLRPQALWHFDLEPALSFGAVRGTSASVSTPIAVARGTPAAKVAISGEAEEIEVRIDNVPPGESGPLVLLCSVTGNVSPRVGELRKVPGTSYWIARFEHVGPGDYLVAFEPIDH